MTSKALTAHIEKSENKDWFKELSLTLDFNVNNTKKELKGFSEIYLFFHNELKKWKKEDAEVTVDPIKSSLKWLQDASKVLEKIIEDDQLGEGEYYLKQSWNGTFNTRYLPGKALYLKEFRETDFLLELNKFNEKWVESAHNYFIGEVDPYNKSSEVFEGRMLAYEFKTKELAALVGRKKQDQEALAKLRGDYESLLRTIETESEKVQTELEERNEKHISYVEKSENATTKNLEELDKYFYLESEKLAKETDERFKLHEETYKELLKLKAPAEYWETRARTLNHSGKKWLLLLIGISLAGCLVVFLLVNNLSKEHILEHISNPAVSIRWSILSLVLLGVIAYLMRIVTKMMMSSYHLYRDAEERKQLTYLYLSLMNESSVSDADRTIVLQALFSRADTGLLKEDSSPTMPAIHLDKFNS